VGISFLNSTSQGIMSSLSVLQRFAESSLLLPAGREEATGREMDVREMGKPLAGPATPH
jgi:hypothetical protein